MKSESRGSAPRRATPRARGEGAHGRMFRALRPAELREPPPTAPRRGLGFRVCKMGRRHRLQTEPLTAGLTGGGGDGLKFRT